MARLLVVLALLALILLLFSGPRRLGSLSPARRQKLVRNGLIAAIVVIPLTLVATGRLSWIVGLLAPAGLLLQRIFRLLMLLLSARRFADQVRAEHERARRASNDARHTGEPDSTAGGPRAHGNRGRRHRAGPPNRTTQGLIEEAYAVLGLKAGATRREIVEAHRRLIRQVHPDKGGTDYLAAKINSARDLLLQHVRT